LHIAARALATMAKVWRRAFPSWAKLL